MARIPSSHLPLDQLLQEGVQHQQAGRLPEAEALYREILRQDAQHADALHLMGLIAFQSGAHDAAAKLMRRAIASRPHFPEAYCNLAITLQAAGKASEAVTAARQAIALRANFPEAHYNLGNALRSQGHSDDAIAAYREAIKLRPNFAQAFHNLGTVLKGQGRLDDAITVYRQAIAIQSNFAEAHYNLGNALSDQSKPDAAISAYREAIALRPDYFDAYNNLGNALASVGRLEEAIADYRQALALKPDFTSARSSVVFFLHCLPGVSAGAIAAELRVWSGKHAEPLQRLARPHSNDRAHGRRLKIGYVSPDLRQHVVGQNLLPLLRHHDRKQYEIICYANVPCPDSMTAQLRQHVDLWRSTVRLSDEQVAAQIRLDEIDILVDLALHTAQNRLLVFARKPAPVQLTWLGYCGSTGLSAMDYRLSDPHLDPPDADLSCYVEKTLCLPRTFWCYQPGGVAPESPRPPVIDNGFITFGCLNNFAKVSPVALDLWCRILAALPDSRLIIHAPAGNHLTDIEQRFTRAGVQRDRLHFVGAQPWLAYAQTYWQIDIALDPFPFGGGITTCDALWMGVPVVTLSGLTPVGRGGRSILSNLGLPELIAFTPDQYVQIATDLARDRDRLIELRSTMRARMLASPLMDAPQFARNIEAAYRRMWQTWCTLP